MVVSSLGALEDAIRAGWSVWTSDPVDQPGWSPSNPAWGQCASTALVVQDLLGGDLLLADVHQADGTAAGVHFWNRLGGGFELDLTREQFRERQVLGAPRPIERPVDVTRGRLPGQYHLLSARVTRALSDAGPASMAWPVTVKAVCGDDDGRVLLCRNRRGEWELPGGRPHLGEPFHECVIREVCEETGLAIGVDRLLGVSPLEVLPGAWVDVLAYDCVLSGGEPVRSIRASAEHVEVAFVEARSLSDRDIPPAYRALIERR